MERIVSFLTVDDGIQFFFAFRRRLPWYFFRPMPTILHQSRHVVDHELVGIAGIWCRHRVQARRCCIISAGYAKELYGLFQPVVGFVAFGKTSSVGDFWASALSV